MSLLWLDCRAGKAVYSCGEGTGLLLGPKASWFSPALLPPPRGQAPPAALRTRRGPRPAALRLRASLWVSLCEFRAAVGGGKETPVSPPPHPPLSGRGRGRAWPVATSVPGSLTHTQPLGGLPPPSPGLRVPPNPAPSCLSLCPHQESRIHFPGFASNSDLPGSTW